MGLEVMWPIERLSTVDQHDDEGATSRVDDYDYFGGEHWESANARKVLAHAGYIAPHTGEPLSETLCFGLGGGIGAGYGFCPSACNDGSGSGMWILGRHKLYDTGSKFTGGIFRRLGIQADIRETAGRKSAFKNVLEAVSSGRPAILWCSKAALAYPCLKLPNAMNLSAHTLVVFGVDEVKGIAHVG
jgi:hypothetical protein